MPENLAAALEWVVPAVIVFGLAAVAVVVVVWLIRRARRSPRARAAAIAARDRAGASLVQLDDAVDELDLEVGLSGALYGGGTPTTLRRARLTAQRVRDSSFEEYRMASGEDASNSDIRRIAARIERRTSEALATIARARSEHVLWMAANVSAADQVSGARDRLRALRAAMGEPGALVDDLSDRFAEDEWASAARAAHSATALADDAERLLDLAASQAGDPSQSALTELAAAERALRQAEDDARVLEEAHRLVTQAALAVPGEFEAIRNALRSTLTARGQLEPEAAERLGGELRAIDAELGLLARDAARRPTRTVAGIARLRMRLDLAAGDAWTSQQRVRGARTALPGTLAAARSALVAAEESMAHVRAGADARSRLLSAQAELAGARQSTDPVAALDAARRAIRDAEDAKALADYSRLVL